MVQLFCGVKMWVNEWIKLIVVNRIWYVKTSLSVIAILLTTALDYIIAFILALLCGQNKHLYAVVIATFIIFVALASSVKLRWWRGEGGVCMSLQLDSGTIKLRTKCFYCHAYREERHTVIRCSKYSEMRHRSSSSWCDHHASWRCSRMCGSTSV